MCIKAGDNELESVKNLMGMALRAAVAEALQVDLDQVVEEARLREDLAMNADKSRELAELIADTFDGFEVDPTRTPTVGALLEQVVLNEFQGLPV